MKVLFIIVTYNAMPWIDKCFTSIADIPRTIKCDAFVIDNGSIDGTQAYIQQHFPWFFFQQSDKNIGFGKANNLGLQYALDNNYDYVYLLNQDAWVQPSTISSLIEISQKYPEYGILSPFQMSADLLSIDRGFSKRLRTWDSYFIILNDLYNNNCKDVYQADSVMAAHWFITRDCLEKVGGFSPTFPHYGEDDNYSERVKYKGFLIGVIPKLKVVHDRADRKTDKKKQMYLDYTDGLFKLSCPNVRVSKAFLIILSRALTTAIRFLSFIPLKYLWMLFVQYPHIKKNRLTSIRENCAFLK